MGDDFEQLVEGGAVEDGFYVLAHDVPDQDVARLLHPLPDPQPQRRSEMVGYAVQPFERPLRCAFLQQRQDRDFAGANQAVANGEWANQLEDHHRAEDDRLQQLPPARPLVREVARQADGDPRLCQQGSYNFV